MKLSTRAVVSALVNLGTAGEECSRAHSTSQQGQGLLFTELLVSKDFTNSKNGAV